MHYWLIWYCVSALRCIALRYTVLSVPFCEIVRRFGPFWSVPWNSEAPYRPLSRHFYFELMVFISEVKLRRPVSQFQMILSLSLCLSVIVGLFSVDWISLSLLAFTVTNPDYRALAITSWKHVTKHFRMAKKYCAQWQLNGSRCLTHDLCALDLHSTITTL